MHASFRVPARILAGLSAIGLCVSACTDDTTGPAGTQGEFKIAYSSIENGRAILYVMNADGSARVRLSDSTTDSMYPEWAPDGQTLIYVQGSSKGDLAVQTMKFDGADKKKITTDAGDDWDERPVWSPAGNAIAYVASTGMPGAGGIYRLNPDGTDRRLLRTGSSPVWSADGARMAFLEEDYVTSVRQVFIMDADGSGARQLTFGASSCRYPSWSPDGTQIAYVATGTGAEEIHSIRSDGTKQLRLTNGVPFRGDSKPRWSPDGSKIAFVSRRDSTAEIYAMDADGSNQKRLTVNAAADMPTWSPDGSSIRFVGRFGANEYRIFTVNPDGTNLRSLGSLPGFSLYPAWSPVRLP